MSVDFPQTIIRDLKPGMKSINLVFIVLEVGRPNTTKDGHEVRTCKIADRSASVNLSVWDEPGIHIQPGDICKLTKGYASVWKNCLTLYTGKGGDIIKIGEFCMAFSELPNMSEPNAEFVQMPPNKLQVTEQPRGSPTPQQPFMIPPLITSTSTSSVPSTTTTGNGNHSAPFPTRGINRFGVPRPAVSSASHNNGVNNKIRLGRR